MDINNDTYVDMVTLQDGDGGGEGFRNRVLINNKQGGFTDQSATFWPTLQNTLSYDFMAAFLDANSDRKPDLALGAFAKFADRLMTLENGAYVANTDPWGP
ncbi:FG-GAP-like repeat-containing protein, partial [Arthrospira platensis SPKY1]|nr:FG-GAP-like repeat-containing protein [Arthrospira platensis SPKY1]